MIRSIFERLDTTPGQEKAVKVALDELRAAARTARDTLNAARASIAATMREESFDEVALGGAAAQLDEAAAVVRKAAISAFATVHGALESHQRRKLADLIAHGGPFSAEWPEPGRNRYTL